MSGELNPQEFRELVVDAYLTDPIPPITCMTDKALLRLEELLRQRYDAQRKQAAAALPQDMGQATIMGDCIYAGIFEDEVSEVKSAVVIKFESDDKLRDFSQWHHGITQPAAQATPEPLTLGPLAKRNIYDAIRGAYDLGYNDARNARTVPGDSAPGYEGRSVEEDHGGALFNLLSRRLKTATPPQQAAGEPVGEPLQGGLDNDALLNAWRSKLPGVTPTDAQMTAFALGVEVGFAHARKLERSDWSRVHPGRTDDHLADVIAKALSTHPAPGVPEGFALVPMTEDQVWHNDSIMSANAIGGLKMDAVMRIVRGVEAHHSERLAAAQAKGGAA